MTTEIITVEASEIQTKKFMQAGLVDRFVRFAGVCDKSASTYKIALRQMFKYFAANSIVTPTREDLEIWRDSLIAEKKSPSTVQLYLCSCKLFFRWTAQEGIFANIADHLKSKVKVSHEHKKDALTTSQAGTLIKGVKGSTVKAKRDRAILALMVSTGVRCIEVCRADVGDMVQQFGRTYLLIQGKGHSAKDARILLPAQVEALIRDYLKARGNANDTQPLFTSTANRNFGSRLTTQTISKMVKAQLRAVGFDTPRLTAHSLRHSALTAMLIAGCELTQVQQVARHVSIVTTQIYNHTIERMKNTAEQIAANAIFDTISA